MQLKDQAAIVTGALRASAPPPRESSPPRAPKWGYAIST